MLTPVTAFYAGLLSMLFFYLTALVILERRGKRIGLGDNGDKHLSQLIRAHGNFTEYTPLILVLMLVAELNHIAALWLHIAGSLLLFGRILHSVGLRRHSGASWQRVSGMIMTCTALFSLAVCILVTLF